MNRRLIIPCSICALVFVIAAPVAVAQRAPAPVEQTTRDDAASSPKRPVTVAPSANDSQIAERLQGILDTTGWFEKPSVSVSRGVVSLDGRTASQEHRDWAGKLAENTQDVVAVVNRIEVASDAESTLVRARSELYNLYVRALQTWPLLALAIAILVITWGVAKLTLMLARRMLSEKITSPLLLSVVARAIAFPVVILGVYFILQIAGLTRLALTILGGTGLIGIIVGFSFRDIAENFLASLLLSIRNPFSSGDLVEIAGHTGIVQNLNTRSTVLLTLDGSHVQIPNATVYKSTIKNFSSNPGRRATFTVGIGYDASTAKAQKLISQVLRDHPAVREAPEPLVLLEELSAATVNLRIYYWFDSEMHSPARINSALLRQTKNVLMEGGVSLPDPAREVVFPDGVPVTMAERPAKEKRPAADREPRLPDKSSPALDDADDATIGEGELATEANDLCVENEAAVPEARENLLKR